MFTEFCVLAFLHILILKVAKEKVKEKEKEEFPERPGQTECKVITFFCSLFFFIYNF